MLLLRGIRKDKGWAVAFFVAVLAIAAAILWIGQPVAANAESDSLTFEDNNVLHTLTFDAQGNNLRNVEIDGQPAELMSGHIKGFRESTKTQKGRKAEIYDGSTCILISGHWIGYPPGTRCP